MLDTIIIGAGAAGLACASKLAASGAKIAVLEARDRLGGRILTERAAGLDAPIELGAEFIHGEAEPLRQVAASFDAPTIDISGQRFLYARGRIRQSDRFWSRLDRIARILDGERAIDRSFAAALAAHSKSLSAADRRLAVQYVEGYHAADTTIISEKALADGGFPEGEEHEQRIGRVVSGYGPLIGRLGAAVLPQIQLGAIVSRVTWRQGHVDVMARDPSGRALPAMSARTAAVTVPIGVLAAGPGEADGIQFDPPLPPSHRRAISSTTMGAVVKLVLRFKRAFWHDPKLSERLGVHRLDQMSFAQSQERLRFPVWWSAYPVDAPLLVAWRGGPMASTMSRMTVGELERLALESLASIFATSRSSLRRELVATFYHDWINDPFSRGVYSYARVGGANACVALSRAVRGTIWFAGEAADRVGRTGTVHGAIGSGWRAADEILRR